MISKQLKEELVNNIKSIEEDLSRIVDLGNMSSLYVQFHYNEKTDPQWSTKISMHKSELFYIENGKEIEGTK